MVLARLHYRAYLVQLSVYFSGAHFCEGLLLHVETHLMQSNRHIGLYEYTRPDNDQGQALTAHWSARLGHDLVHLAR
jgi:hypothetical protein